MVIVVFFLLLLCVSSSQSATPSLSIKPCPADFNWTQTALIREFTLDDGSRSPLQQTSVHACYDDKFFHARFDCVDNNIYNTYTQCNSPLYNQDVVELFIGSKSHSSPAHYIEIEISPNNVLFVSNVTNYSGNCSNFQGNEIDCDQSGVKIVTYRSDKTNSWWAQVAIPFALVQTLPGAEWSTLPSTLAVNFYRIDEPKETQSREFSCWSPTMASPACFHKPDYFGNIELIK